MKLYLSACQQVLKALAQMLKPSNIGGADALSRRDAVGVLSIREFAPETLAGGDVVSDFFG